MARNWYHPRDMSWLLAKKICPVYSVRETRSHNSDGWLTALLSTSLLCYVGLSW